MALVGTCPQEEVVEVPVGQIQRAVVVGPEVVVVLVGQVGQVGRVEQVVQEVQLQQQRPASLSPCAPSPAAPASPALVWTQDQQTVHRLMFSFFHR